MPLLKSLCELRSTYTAETLSATKPALSDELERLNTGEKLRILTALRVRPDAPLTDTVRHAVLRDTTNADQQHLEALVLGALHWGTSDRVNRVTNLYRHELGLHLDLDTADALTHSLRTTPGVSSAQHRRHAQLHYRTASIFLRDITHHQAINTPDDDTHHNQRHDALASALLRRHHLFGSPPTLHTHPHLPITHVSWEPSVSSAEHITTHLNHPITGLHPRYHTARTNNQLITITEKATP